MVCTHVVFVYTTLALLRERLHNLAELDRDSSFMTMVAIGINIETILALSALEGRGKVGGCSLILLAVGNSLEGEAALVSELGEVLTEIVTRLARLTSDGLSLVIVGRL